MSKTIFTTSFYCLKEIMREIYYRPCTRTALAKKFTYTRSYLSQYITFLKNHALLDEQLINEKNIISLSLNGYIFLKHCESIADYLKVDCEIKNE
jgi:hypothetical protein